jgi:phosphatidylglycerophosphatase A
MVSCLPPYSEEIQKPSASSKSDDGLDEDYPFFLVKRLVIFFYMFAALFLTIIYLGFSTGNKAHKNYLEYGLQLDLGWILMDETKLEVGRYV